MLTRREVVIEKPFQDRRYSNHRKKVTRALPRIDTGPPPEYSHLDIKMKKLRIETDRQTKICEDNLRLVHRLAIIMRSKRMDDINNSSRGPFEKKGRFPSPVKVKPHSREEGESPEPDDGVTFLEKVTKEAIRRAPRIKKKVIQHRAPHGFCRVPELGITVISPLSFRSRVQERRHFYAITTGHLKQQIKSMESTSDGASFSYVEYQNKSVQISMSDLNQTSDTNNFTSTTSFNGRTTIEETNGLDDFSKTPSEEDQESDHEIAKKIIEQGETPSSEAEDDTVISCSGFTEIEKNNSKKSDEEGSSFDSDDHVTSVLLRSTPNITIDEASDEDFFK